MLSQNAPYFPRQVVRQNASFTPHSGKPVTCERMRINADTRRLIRRHTLRRKRRNNTGKHITAAALGKRRTPDRADTDLSRRRCNDRAVALQDKDASELHRKRPRAFLAVRVDIVDRAPRKSCHFARMGSQNDITLHFRQYIYMRSDVIYSVRVNDSCDALLLPQNVSENVVINPADTAANQQRGISP